MKVQNVVWIPNNTKFQGGFWVHIALSSSCDYVRLGEMVSIAYGTAFISCTVIILYNRQEAVTCLY
jgi:hypothetical protein